MKRTTELVAEPGARVEILIRENTWLEGEVSDVHVEVTYAVWVWDKDVRRYVKVSVTDPDEIRKPQAAPEQETR